MCLIGTEKKSQSKMDKWLKENNVYETGNNLPFEEG